MWQIGKKSTKFALPFFGPFKGQSKCPWFTIIPVCICIAIKPEDLSSKLRLYHSPQCIFLCRFCETLVQLYLTHELFFYSSEHFSLSLSVVRSEQKKIYVERTKKSLNLIPKNISLDMENENNKKKNSWKLYAETFVPEGDF